MLVGGREADSDFINGYLGYYLYWHWIIEHGRFNHNCDYLFWKSHAFAEIDPGQCTCGWKVGLIIQDIFVYNKGQGCICWEKFNFAVDIHPFINSILIL